MKRRTQRNTDFRGFSSWMWKHSKHRVKEGISVKCHTGLSDSMELTPFNQTLETSWQDLEGTNGREQISPVHKNSVFQQESSFILSHGAAGWEKKHKTDDGEGYHQVVLLVKSKIWSLPRKCLVMWTGLCTAVLTSHKYTTCRPSTYWLESSLRYELSYICFWHFAWTESSLCILAKKPNRSAGFLENHLLDRFVV